MKTPRATYGFKKLNNQQFLQYCITAHAMLKLNPDYLKLQPDLPDLEALITVYGNALTLAEHGTPAQKQQRNQDRGALTLAMVSITDKVNAEAGGNRAKLVGSALLITPEERTPSVSAIESFKMLPGKSSGQLIAEAKVSGKVSCTIRHTAAPVTADSIWLSETCSRQKCTITNLEPGQKRMYQLELVGTNDQKVYSAMIMAIAM